MFTVPVQMNNFAGVLPAGDDWSSLSIYLASDNAFTGAIPRNLYRAPFLTWLDVSYNGCVCLVGAICWVSKHHIVLACAVLRALPHLAARIV